MVIHFIVSEKWCLFRYWNPPNYHETWLTEAHKGFPKRLDLKDIKFQVKSRDNRKIEKNHSVGISVFGYENKEKYPIDVSKQLYIESHVDLLLKRQGEKNTMFLSKILIRI